MTNLFLAEDELAKTRVDYWQHVMASTLAPYRIRTTDCNLHSQIHYAEIGPVTVLGFQSSAMENIRTPDLIRSSDRGMCDIYLGTCGRPVLEQDSWQTVPLPGNSAWWIWAAQAM